MFMSVRSISWVRWTVMVLLLSFPLSSAWAQSESTIQFPGSEKIANAGFVASLKPGEYVKILVVLSGHKEFVNAFVADDPARRAAVQADIRARQDAVLSRVDPKQAEVGYRYENMAAFSARATPEGIEALAAMEEVAVIEENGAVHPHPAQGIPLMNASSARSS